MSVTIGAAAIFAVVGGYTNDWLGRKPTILLASFVFTTGAVLLGVAVNREMLLAGRIIVGMGIGRPNPVPDCRTISKLAIYTYLINRVDLVIIRTCFNDSTNVHCRECTPRYERPTCYIQ